MAAADQRKAVGVVHVGTAGAQRDILLAGIDQPAIDLVRLRRRAHAEDAVLGLEYDLAFLRHIIGHLQRRANAEIDVPAFGNVVGRALGHFPARHRLRGRFDVHGFLPSLASYVTVGSP